MKTMINIRNIMMGILFPLVIMLFVGCEGDNKRDAPIPILRLDRAVAAGSVPDSMGDGENLLKDVMSEAAGDSVSIEDIMNSRATAMFQPAIESRLGALDSVEIELGSAFAKLKKLAPEEPIPHIYGVVLPFSQSVITTDSVVLVGLNHYLGPDFEGYEGFYDYVRRTKTKRMLAIDVVEAWLSSRYPFETKSDATLLEKMLYYGAVLNVLTELFPETPMATLMRMTPDDEVWLNENLRNVYRSMLEKKMLFSTDPVIASKLLNPSPGSFVISRDAPAMTGRFLGFSIVRSYIENNPDADIMGTLKPDFYMNGETLQKSKFTP